MISPGRRRLYRFLLSSSILLAGYFGVEQTVRRLHLPDPNLVLAIDEQLWIAEKTGVPISRPPSAYGWDRAEAWFSSRAAGASQATVLLMGDSVAQGFGISEESSFAARLVRDLDGVPDFRLVNAAVQGFAFDQMVLKLEAIAPRYRPNLVILAYIPDDLWRCGRNVNYGYTKPVLLPAADGAWQVIPASGGERFVNGYRNAKRWYGLTLWSLWHIADNQRYYFYGWNTDYYRRLFAAFRTRLAAMAARESTNVLVVRLPSTWEGKALPRLDAMGRAAFSPEAPGYRFLDLEPCVKLAAARDRIDYSWEYRWHPRDKGHRLIAECLLPPVRETLSPPASSPSSPAP